MLKDICLKEFECGALSVYSACSLEPGLLAAVTEFKFAVFLHRNVPSCLYRALYIF